MNISDLHAGYEQKELSCKKEIQGLLKNMSTSKSVETNPEETTDDHCHKENADEGIDKVARKKLLIASVMCLFFMVGEATGGAIAHSLAIMTDAAHLLTDFASFLISLFAIFLASRPATRAMSFGWHRAEVVGALVSVLMIWLVTGILVYLAIQRVIHKKFEIDGKVMLITSVVGVAVNLLMAATLHQHGHSHGGRKGDGKHGHSHGAEHSHGIVSKIKRNISKIFDSSNATASDFEDGSLSHGKISTCGHSHDSSNGHSETNDPSVITKKENINVRAAFIHVIGDFLQSIGVMVAAMVIYFKPEYKIADPICTFIFSVLVLLTTMNILRDAMTILMEGTPKELNFNEVMESLQEIPGVVEVHNLRIWSLTMDKNAVSVHLAITDMTASQKILKKANKLLSRRFLLQDITIQMEQYVASMSDCRQCQELKK